MVQYGILTFLNEIICFVITMSEEGSLTRITRWTNWFDTTDTVERIVEYDNKYVGT